MYMYMKLFYIYCITLAVYHFRNNGDEFIISLYSIPIPNQFCITIDKHNKFKIQGSSSGHPRKP